MSNENVVPFEKQYCIVFFSWIPQLKMHSRQAISGPFTQDEAEKVANKMVITDGVYDMAEVRPMGLPTSITAMDGDGDD